MSILYSNYLLPAFPNAPAGAPVSSYVGPGDIATGWVMWAGLRGFSQAVAATGTQNAVNVRRGDTNATTDIKILTSGKLDTVSLAAFAPGVDATGTGAITGTALTFTGGHIGDVVTGGTTLAGTVIVSGTSPTWTVNLSQTVPSTTLTLTWGMFVTKSYDQSGSGHDVSNPTTASQPWLMQTGGPSNGPCMLFAGTQQISTAAPVAASTGGFSFVGIRTSTFTSVNTVLAQPASQSLGFLTANLVYMSAGTTLSQAATDNVWHAVNGVFNTTSSIIAADGSSSTGAAGSSASGTVISIGEYNNTQFLHGALVEFGRSTTTITSGAITSLNANQHGTNGWNF